MVGFYFVLQMKTSHAVWNDEKIRLTELCSSYAATIEELKSKLSALSTAGGSLARASNQTNGDGGPDNFDEQMKSLSQQLLRKQATVQDLLAERSALKVRLHDLETR
jgi:hypothetical protein